MKREDLMRYNMRAGVKNSIRELRILAERLNGFAAYMETTEIPVHGETTERDILQATLRETTRLTRLWEQYQWLELKGFDDA
jgi:hypothetical protein